MSGFLFLYWGDPQRAWHQEEYAGGEIQGLAWNFFQETFRESDPVHFGPEVVGNCEKDI